MKTIMVLLYIESPQQGIEDQRFMLYNSYYVYNFM